MIKAKKRNKGIATNVDLESGQNKNTGSHYFKLSVRCRSCGCGGFGCAGFDSFHPSVNYSKIQFDV